MTMRKLNKFQAAVARTYGGGDYAYMIEESNPDYSPRAVGDTHFSFLMQELADTGLDTMTYDVAVQRMQTAQREQDEALAAVCSCTE